MIRNFFYRSLVISAAVLALALASSAQQAAQNSAHSSASKRKTAAPKPKTKVWTDDNIGSVRTPADNYEERQEARADLKEASATQPVGSSQTTGSAQQPKDHPPLLSNPKTVDSADQMIGWEDRDIAAQTEFIGNLQQELASAPPQDKPRLQNLLAQKQQLLEQTKAERQGLVNQKKELQRKAAGPNGSN